MSKQFKKLSHTIYECKYHIVCCPKYRHRIFKEEIKEYTKSQVYILCRHLWSRGYCVSTVGLNEKQIREYVKYQEKKEKEIEKKQMSLFK